MKNTISFNTKFGWISATELNNKITRIRFSKEKQRGKISRKLRYLKKNFINYFKYGNKNLKIQVQINGNKIQKKKYGVN